MPNKSKSQHGALVNPAMHCENDFPAYAGEVKPAAPRDSVVAHVSPTTAREHDPLLHIEKIEKMPAKGVKKHKRMASEQ